MSGITPAFTVFQLVISNFEPEIHPSGRLGLIQAVLRNITWTKLT